MDAAGKYAIPTLLLLACLKAESGLNPEAQRYGMWPDVSFGFGQQTVEYAPWGDGSDTPANIALVRAKLFDRQTAIDLAAAHLGPEYASAGDMLTSAATPDERILCALSAYNSGSIQAPGNWWWTGPGCANYRAALIWAHSVTGE